MLTPIQLLVMLRGFCFEALSLLNVDESLFPQICHGVAFNTDGKAIPVYINYSLKKIFFLPQFLQLYIFSFFGDTNNDRPTVYRQLGYTIAILWNRFLKTGLQEQPDKISPDDLALLWAMAILKGVPINELFPKYLVDGILRSLRNDFGVECETVKAVDTSGRTRTVVTMTKSAAKNYIAMFEDAVKESYIHKTPKLSFGEKGATAQNPFDNLNEAVDFVLALERQELEKDRFRAMVASQNFFFDGIFRISWACPYTAFMPQPEGKKFVATQMDSTHLFPFNRFLFKPSLHKRKFLFRGQAEFYDPCVPNLFRKQKQNFTDDNIKVQELEILMKSHPLVQLFDKGFTIFNEFFCPKVNYYGLSQHYYNKTSLLDLTSDMEVAKFFAVTTYDWQTDTYKIYDGNKVGVLYYYNLYPDAFVSRPGRNYNIEAIGKQPFRRSGNQAGFLIALDKEMDFNKLPEVGMVFFRHDPDISREIYEKSLHGAKYLPTELLQKHWHRRISDPKMQNVYSNEALRANFRQNPGVSHSHIRRTLDLAGIRIKSYHPCFSDNELDLYYDTALSYWEDFCNDIHFSGPEGAVMEDHLRNLPNNPDYKKYFVREA